MKWVIKSIVLDPVEPIYWTGNEWSSIKIMSKLYLNEDAAKLDLQYLKGRDDQCNRAVTVRYDETTNEERKDENE